MHFTRGGHYLQPKLYHISSVINSKDLDPSCKMDLDLLDCLGRVKLIL